MSSSGLRALPVLVGMVLAVPAGTAAAPVQPIEVHTRAITEFQAGRAGTGFGRLAFNGGLEMTSPSADLGAFSAMRFLDAGSRFIGVADTGFWFFGSVVRDANGRPAGIADFRMQQIVDAQGFADDRKWEVDAESLALRDGIAVVGFERNHRVSRFRLDPAGMGPPLGDIPLLIPPWELRQNRSLEGLAFRPDGGLVVVTEKSLDSRGDIFAAVIQGSGKGVFTVKRTEPFDVSDCAFLPNGDLLLLERSFSMAEGVGLRLRRIPASLVRGGALADGPVLMQADMGYQIDNMEALDVWRRADGALMVSMMSDDNHSMLQRNLYLEFILQED